MIINSGIREVVYRRHYSIDDVSMRLLNEAGVTVRSIDDGPAGNGHAGGCGCHEN